MFAEKLQENFFLKSNVYSSAFGLQRYLTNQNLKKIIFGKNQILAPFFGKCGGRGRFSTTPTDQTAVGGHTAVHQKRTYSRRRLKGPARVKSNGSVY